MTNINGTNLAAAIAPFTTEDEYPTHYSQYGKGSWHEVATVEERDLIPVSRRSEGMAVFVINTKKLYTLENDLTTWTEYSSAGSIVPPYILNFVEGDWALNGSVYNLTIGSSTHNQGTTSSLVVFVKDSEGNSLDVDYSVSSAGLITLEAVVAFAGSLVISSLSRTENQVDTSFIPAGTYTIGASGRFATIADAFTFLEGKFSNGVVNLQLLDGTHDITSVNVPNVVCERIRITGNATDNSLTVINCQTRTTAGVFNGGATAFSVSDVTIVDTNNTVVSRPRIFDFHKYGSVLTLENKINITVDYPQLNDNTIIYVGDFAQVCIPFTYLTLTGTGSTTLGLQSFTGNVNITLAVITASNLKNIIYVSGAGKATINTATFNETNITSRYNIAINQINNTAYTAGSVIYVR